MKIKNSFIIALLFSALSSNCYAFFAEIQLAGGAYTQEKVLITESKQIEKMFIEALGGDEAYNKIAIIDLKNKTATSIRPEMMPASIVKGVDSLERRFIAYKQEKIETGEQGVEVFYQRYTDSPDLWINGGDHALRYLFPINRGVITKKSIEQFTNMIREEDFFSVYDIDHQKYKTIDLKKPEDIYVSDEAIEKIAQVIRTGFCTEPPSGVEFLEKGDNRIFTIKNLAPNTLFKYYSRDTSSGFYINSWYENAQFAKNISELYELDLLLIPKTKILKIDVDGRDYFVMAKEDVSSQSLLNKYKPEELQKLSGQLVTFLFKTGFGGIDPESLALIDIAGQAKAAIDYFEEFNYGVVNHHLVDQFFDIDIFGSNRELIEIPLKRFTYFDSCHIPASSGD